MSCSLIGLQKSRKWAEFVYRYAITHGWEAFVIKNCQGGVVYLIPMPASEERNGLHIYTGSYNKRLDAGIPLSMRDAMTLAIYYKTSNPDLYRMWEAGFQSL